MLERPDRVEAVCILLMAIIVMILLLLSTPANAEPMAPEDIKVELNGEKFQYGDTLRITIHGDNNTTYRFFIEDKSLFLRLKYIPIWCNWSGVGTASRTLIKPEETPDPEFELSLLPKWHIAYIKLPNVTSGNPMVEFKVEYTQEDMYAMFLETSEDVKETDKEERFWTIVWIAFLIFILITINIAIVWKKIIPYNIRLHDPVYDKDLGQTVRPYEKYTKLETILIFIANKLAWSRTKRRMRRKQSKTTYHGRNITGDSNPPEKIKQKLDSNKHYLRKLENENKALLFLRNSHEGKLKALREAPEVERDIQAIHLKENEIGDLRTKRAEVGNKINETRKTIKTQEAELKKLMEEERKGVFLK